MHILYIVENIFYIFPTYFLFDGGILTFPQKEKKEKKTFCKLLANILVSVYSLIIWIAQILSTISPVLGI